MENYLIPHFKQVNKNNAFLSDLINSKSKYASKYRLSVNTNDLKNPISAGKFEMILQDFDKISNLDSGVKTMDGKIISYGDLFFLYKNSRDSLSILFQNYAKNVNSLNNKLALYYSNYDINHNNLDIDPSDLIFSFYNKFENGNKTLYLKSFEGEDEKIELDNKYYTFNVGVSDHTEKFSSTLLVNKLINNLKNNIITLELNCNGL